MGQIRNRICREGRCVKLVEVIQELCSFYKVSCVGELYPLNSRPIRREGDIPALYEIMQANGKVRNSRTSNRRSTTTNLKNSFSCDIVERRQPPV